MFRIALSIDLLLLEILCSIAEAVNLFQMIFQKKGIFL